MRGNGHPAADVATRMSAPQTFAVTWDYRCPFARNGHEHILDGLEAGAEWDVTFVPYFLNQGMGLEGQDTWDDPDHRADLLSLEVAVVVRDRLPEQFLAVHRALFDARHVDGADLRDRQVVADVLDGAGVDAAAVLAEVDAGWPAKVVRSEHERCVEQLDIFGRRPGPRHDRPRVGPHRRPPRAQRVQAHTPVALSGRRSGVATPRRARRACRPTPASRRGCRRAHHRSR